MKVKNISEHVQCLLCTSLKGENPPPAFLSLALGSLGELFQLKKNPGKMAGYLLRVSPDGVYWRGQRMRGCRILPSSSSIIY